MMGKEDPNIKEVIKVTIQLGALHTGIRHTMALLSG